MPRISTKFFALQRIPVAIFGLLSRTYRNTYLPLLVKQGVTFVPATEVFKSRGRPREREEDRSSPHGDHDFIP